jgi:maleylacetoacetate isomerase
VLRGEIPGGVILYSYFRSSSAYRVRIALNLKGLPFEYRPVALRDGDQHAAAYRALNPQRMVPLLIDGEVRIAQSLAILEYLEERFPARPLLPAGPAARARARSIALHIACDIQPLQNLRVDRYLAESLGADEDAVTAWRRHWVGTGLAAVEAMLDDGPFGGGEAPGLADCLLVPQVYNARRFGVDLEPLPRVRRAWEACVALDAFQRAAPEAQPDAP